MLCGIVFQTGKCHIISVNIHQMHYGMEGQGRSARYYPVSLVLGVYSCDYGDDGTVEILVANAPWGAPRSTS
jgi:hypothetical protein